MPALRTRNLYDPNSDKPFRLSRSKIDSFLNCPRCFYLDRRLGLGQPDGPPFTLNVAVDALLKKEFDIYRERQEVPPICKQHGIDAVPYKHSEIDKWRESLRGGVEHAIPGTNLVISGGVDDVWVTPAGELIVVDYKATAKNREVTIDEEWQIAYKRQMEIYQWLFRKNGFKVHPTGYFLYCNGVVSESRFDGVLKFVIKLIPYSGNGEWIDGTIAKLYECLLGDAIPAASAGCKFCAYRDAARGLEG